METHTVINKEFKIKEIDPQPSSIVTNPVEKMLVKFLFIVELFALTLKSLRNPFKAVSIIRKIKRKYSKIFGEKLLTKIAKVDGKYYWRLATPGFPSKTARTFRANAINRIFPFKPYSGLSVLLFGITKKCPLSCEHCYEWDRMHQKEKLSSQDLIQIMHKYQDYGTTQIMLGGGEPMLRIQDIYTLLQKSKGGTDFWIFTSGYNFKAEFAKELKSKGLTGVLVSLDHFIPEKHDQFRGMEGAYNMAINAAKEAKNAKLVVGLSFCPTKEFTTENNLYNYMELAKKLGVSFVQILEPIAAGRYKGKKVFLSEDQLKLLEKLYLKYNYNKTFKDYPIINYLGYHQRRVGCFGGGNYYFYIDTDGDVHVCPMCAGKVCNALAFSAEDTINLLKQTQGCHYFSQSLL